MPFTRTHLENAHGKSNHARRGMGRVCAEYGSEGDMAGGRVPFWRASAFIQSAANSPSFELTLLSKPLDTCKDRQLSWLPARPLP